MNVLGTFLETSIHCADVLESLQFYEKLGFSQVATNDTWKHPYGVVTDGRCFLGLHAFEFPGPALTFVAPDLRKRVEALEAAGAQFEFLKLADDEFHELGFFMPDEQMVTLLEARTFSPPGTTPVPESIAGWFAEYRLPVDDRDLALAQWLRMGLIECEPADALHDSVSACCTGLNVGFTESRRVRQPLLVFHALGLEDRLAALAQRSIKPDQFLPASPGRPASALFRAPEGTRLLLVENA